MQDKKHVLLMLILSKFSHCSRHPATLKDHINGD